MHNINVILTKRDERYRSLYFKIHVSFFLNTNIRSPSSTVIINTPCPRCIIARRKATRKNSSCNYTLRVLNIPANCIKIFSFRNYQSARGKYETYMSGWIRDAFSIAFTLDIYINIHFSSGYLYVRNLTRCQISQTCGHW